MKKVILVDDNQDILSMWKMFLAKLGYEPVTFSTAEEFKTLLESDGLQGVGCVVCDESLQDGLGSGLFDLVIEKKVDVPFIIVSGYPEEEIIAKVKSAEKLKVLKKPISLADLKSEIESCFAKG